MENQVSSEKKIKWMTQEQLEKKYSNNEFRQSFTKLYSIYLFYQNSVIQEGYNPPKDFGKAIYLTQLGEEWAKKIDEWAKVKKEKNKDFPDYTYEDIKYILFSTFCHKDLFIDVKKTDYKKLLKILNDDVLQGRIKHPMFYDRTLYDRYLKHFQV